MCVLLSMILLSLTWLSSEARTVNGILTTERAKETAGQYVGNFCFHGVSGVVQYSLNATGTGMPSLYMYPERDWEQAVTTEMCAEKLDLAKFKHEMTNSTGYQIIQVPNTSAQMYHIVYVDSYTCDKSRPLTPLEKPNFLQFKIQFLNPDPLGNPTDHFSVEESGLFRFYQLLVLGYFIAACIYGPRLHEALQKGGPMNMVIQLLSAAMALQAIGSLTMVVHLRGYSKNGIGSPLLEILSEFFDMLSQFVMLYMLLSLSLGWTLAGTYKGTASFAKLREKPAAKVVAVIAALQGVLFIWEQYEENKHLMFHAHRSYAGIALVLVRILLAGLFAWNLNTTVSLERSALKRQFYTTFTKCCMLWFLCYPAMTGLSWLFSPYLRFKLVTMTVVLCQCGAVLTLYRLFLSRSLYWELSSLSSYLPLRMDKRLGSKLYS